MRLFDISGPARPVQVGRFGTVNTFADHVHAPTDEGRYSVHNPIVPFAFFFAWTGDNRRRWLGRLAVAACLFGAAFSPGLPTTGTCEMISL